jgi:hypothetical protein
MVFDVDRLLAGKRMKAIGSRKKMWTPRWILGCMTPKVAV